MKIRFSTVEERRTKKMTWQRWFAWRPVQLTDNTWVWLEVIERRLCERPITYYSMFYPTMCETTVDEWTYRLVPAE